MTLPRGVPRLSERGASSRRSHTAPGLAYETRESLKVPPPAVLTSPGCTAGFSLPSTDEETEARTCYETCSLGSQRAVEQTFNLAVKTPHPRPPSHCCWRRTQRPLSINLCSTNDEWGTSSHHSVEETDLGLRSLPPGPCWREASPVGKT